jgi:cyanate lyase
MKLGPQELTVALTMINRAPLKGSEAKAVAVTIDKIEKALDWLMARPVPKPQEETNGDDADITK